MFLIIRICGTGVLAFLAPRILVAAGVPLDEWAQTIGTSIAGVNAMTKEMAINVVGIVFALVLITVELWWKPFGRLFNRLQGGNKQLSQHIHNYHNCVVYQNADGTGTAKIPEGTQKGKPEKKAYIKVDLQKLLTEGTIYDSSNISSVTDNGINDFSFNFTIAMDPNYVVKINSDKTVNFEVVEKPAPILALNSLAKNPA